MNNQISTTRHFFLLRAALCLCSLFLVTSVSFADKKDHPPAPLQPEPTIIKREVKKIAPKPPKKAAKKAAAKKAAAKKAAAKKAAAKKAAAKKAAALKRKKAAKKLTPPVRHTPAVETETWKLTITPSYSNSVPAKKHVSTVIHFFIDKQTQIPTGASSTEMIPVDSGSASISLIPITPLNIVNVQEKKTSQKSHHKKSHSERSHSHRHSKRPRVNPADYRRVYQSIPFNHAEYLANPSYRHEATMAILFGRQPHVVIHKQAATQAPAAPLRRLSRLQMGTVLYPNPYPNWSYRASYRPYYYFTSRYRFSP